MAIKTILVPTDFSENSRVAFARALDLSRQLGAKLYLLHVQDETTLRTAVKEGLLREDSTDEMLEAEVARLTEQRFEQMLSGHDLSGVHVERVTRRGEGEFTISRFARDIDAGMVVVGLRGAGLIGMLRSAVMGSVAESVIKKSPCPVLVVRLDHK
jgi:nucleotide-binding universal stress UspA family protein